MKGRVSYNRRRGKFGDLSGDSRPSGLLTRYLKVDATGSASRVTRLRCEYEKDKGEGEMYHAFNFSLADHRKKNLRSDHIPNHKHDALFSNSPDSKSSFGGKVPLAALQVASPSEMV